MAEDNFFDFEGEYVSLAGRKGKNGLVSKGDHQVSVGSSGTPLLPKNGSRVHATIRNMTDRDGFTPSDFSIVLADQLTSVTTPQSITLRPGDLFKIDREHPWSGPVTGITEIGVTSGADVLEVSIA